MKQFHIQWHILDRCNLRCTHCYQDNYSNSQELDLNSLIRIADNLNYSMKNMHRHLNLSITGGEPLLSDHLIELMKYIDNLSFIDQANIITNGTLLEEKLADFSKIKKCQKIFISLDGTCSDSNDSIRGNGVFEKVIKGISNIDRNRFEVFLMFTLMKSNFKDAFVLDEFIKTCNLDGAIIEKFVPLGNHDKNFKNVVTKIHLKELYEYYLTKYHYSVDRSFEIRALMIKRNRHKDRIFPFFSGKNYYKDKMEIKKGICIAGSDGVAVMPNGSIFPCRRLPLPLGNILDASLDKILESNKIYQNLRKRSLIKGKCSTCESTECFGCRAMAYAVSKNYLAADPHCWKEI
ncbi:MAG: radical SAM protein [Spirochaetes bacterium]|nr:radical SAM protein [Spirochaetota bacterium]